jgi:hypothetical protein
MSEDILLEKTSLRFALWCEAPVLNHIVKRRHAGTARSWRPKSCKTFWISGRIK